MVLGFSRPPLFLYNEYDYNYRKIIYLYHTNTTLQAETEDSTKIKKNITAAPKIRRDICHRHH
jgi:hypothetical protein